AFQPLVRPSVPTVEVGEPACTPIDAFVLAKLKRHQLTLSPEADRQTLIRRATFDLIGLPPTPAEVRSFVADPSPDAYARLIDRLLASPAYGERWGRHWLDLARYADSDGLETDADRPTAYHYRDFVIRALNDDLPFDTFARWQLAGDEYEPDNPLALAATGFLTGAPCENLMVPMEEEKLRLRYNELDDIAATTASAFLGLTLGCARCHDHKYDPITQREYYQLFALFNDCDEPTLQVPTDQQSREMPAIATELAAAEKLLADNEIAVGKRQNAWEKDLAGAITAEWKPFEDLPEGARVTSVRFEGLAGFSWKDASVTLGGAPLTLTLAEAHAAVLALKDDAVVEGGKPFEVRLGALDHVAGGPTQGARILFTVASRSAAALPEKIREILRVAPESRTEKQAKALAEHYKAIDKDYAPLADRVAGLKKRQDELRRSITTSLVLAERKESRETRVHLRGDFLRPGAKVEGAVPAVLPSFEPHAGRATRLDLARWLVRRDNPLTARVLVNRVWQAFFGQGLVVTENDLGLQGTPPTHPQILDWLASELMEHGWSLKRLHRSIVTSATYRQSSHARRELADRDPGNALLGRQRRLRLDAEAVRDAALTASGLLTREVGGPGVYPPQPQGVYRFTQVQKYWGESQGADRYRRGMYTYFWRSSPYPVLTVFDAPDATTACTRRVRSNTPLQALTLANDPSFFEMAQSLALRVLREAAHDDAARVCRLFQCCLARAPGDREAERLLALVNSQRRSFGAAVSDAQAAAPASLPDGVDAAEGAAWTAAARAMLNLDEFITRE
ncbi:MAG TPA: DUF1549 and DUF1553 domain-containing protein, partial [Planctomycetota bacterium]|nr:DUF1549 and DUF1553 domain-containing protein [Planctomycetota bacterium]